MMKRKQILISVFLLISMFLSTISPCLASESTIEIQTPAQLLQFAQNCTSDVWSVGKTVELTSDIDMSGLELQPIPIFQGTFHGNHHTISGISFTQKGSKVGLFRTLTSLAVVQDLTVDVALSPDGSASQVGGLAGENNGTIQNCTVTGSLSAKEDVGGLVGLNGESGIIQNCVNQSSVAGVTNVGGIAGQNLGTLLGCQNSGTLNDNPDQTIPTNVGGIAGLSRGIIKQCENTGTIGYQHLGYNMGGIAGMHSGFITSCHNSGTIYGRKDIGGIAGQFEPTTELTYGPDPTEILNENLSTLISQMEQLSQQVYTMTGQGLEDMLVIQNAVSAIQNRTYESGTQGLEDFQTMSHQLDESVRQITRALDHTNDWLTHWNDLSQQDLDLILSTTEELRSCLNSWMDELDDGSRQAISQLSDTTSQIYNQAKTIQSAIHQMAQELESLRQYADTVTHALASGDILGALSTPFPSLNPKGHLQQIGSSLLTCTKLLETLTSQFENIYKQTSNQMNTHREQANEAADQLNRTLSHFIDSTHTLIEQSTTDFDIIHTHCSNIEVLLRDYTDLVAEQAQSTADDIDAQFTIIQDQLNEMNAAATQDNATIRTTTSAIMTSMDKVRQSIYDLKKKPELTISYVRDITDGNGLILSCTSSGTINGDNNLGGIVGTIAPELGDDPEATFSMDELELLSDAVATLRAVVRDCRFDGTVSARNDSAGGIVGWSEVGTLISCISRGTIETGTDYCGGIVGRTKGLVEQCASLVQLSGESWIGGIAGLGQDITGCGAMVQGGGSGEYCGAIAGQATGTLSDNYYLKEHLAGVDGVDYSYQAQGLEFSSFSKLERIPSDFLEFSYRFLINGTVIAEIPFSYGGSIPSTALPSAPERNGQYGQWGTFPTERLTRSLDIEATFQMPTSTLSSGGEHPILLAQGSFPPDAAVQISPAAVPDLSIQTSATPVCAWNYQISNSSEDTVTLRLSTKGAANPVVYCLLDGTWSEMQGELDGSYYVFSAPSQGQLVLLSQFTLPLHPYLEIGVGLFALLGFFLYRRRKTKALSKTAEN